MDHIHDFLTELKPYYLPIGDRIRFFFSPIRQCQKCLWDTTHWARTEAVKTGFGSSRANFEFAGLVQNPDGTGLGSSRADFELAGVP